MAVAGPLGALFASTEGSPPSAEELAWYDEQLPRDAGTLVELMCGYGRLLVPLAEAGFSVHGVDGSVAMLAQCEARLLRASLATTLFRQNVAELNVPFRYGAAFIGGGAFQHLIDIERARAA